MRQTLLDRLTKSLLEAPRGELVESADNRLAAKSMSNVELPTLPLLALLCDHYVGVLV